MEFSCRRSSLHWQRLGLPSAAVAWSSVYWRRNSMNQGGLLWVCDPRSPLPAQLRPQNRPFRKPPSFIIRRKVT